MKVAVLSDIHGNLTALLLVAAHIEQWQPDVTVVNGDVVNRGPLSAACWDYVQEKRRTHGWQLVGGNHEDYVAIWEDEEVGFGGPEFQINRASYWTYRQLDGRVAGLTDLPDRLTLRAPDGSRVRVTHGSMLGNRDGIYPETEDAELRRKIAPAPAVFCTAHTHRPLIRRLDGTLVVNSGSVGASFDGDVRAAYAQLVWRESGWEASIVRLDYDRASTAQQFFTSGFLEGGGPLTRIFYNEWLRARPMVNHWFRRYEEAVLSGEMTLEESVETFLKEEGGQAIIPV